MTPEQRGNTYSVQPIFHSVLPAINSEHLGIYYKGLITDGFSQRNGVHFSFLKFWRGNHGSHGNNTGILVGNFYTYCTFLEWERLFVCPMLLMTALYRLCFWVLEIASGTISYKVTGPTCCLFEQCHREFLKYQQSYFY